MKPCSDVMFDELLDRLNRKAEANIAAVRVTKAMTGTMTVVDLARLAPPTGRLRRVHALNQARG
jgi:hypothetical protein